MTNVSPRIYEMKKKVEETYVRPMQLNEYMETRKKQPTLPTDEFRQIHAINYNEEPGLTYLSNAIIKPESRSGRQLWLELENYSKGVRSDKMNGYQYIIGNNYPFQFQK